MCRLELSASRASGWLPVARAGAGTRRKSQEVGETLPAAVGLVFLVACLPLYFVDSRPSSSVQLVGRPARSLVSPARLRVDVLDKFPAAFRYLSGVIG